MLQRGQPDEFVIATGETRTVREFAELAFYNVGYDIRFEGEGENEVGIDNKSGRTLLRVNPEFFRPTEVNILFGDSSKAKMELGWEREVMFEEMVSRMINNDMKELG